MLRAGIFLCLLALPSLARADILMWRDAQGVKHYTNRRALVPDQETAAVVLEELPQVQTASAAAAAPAAPPAPTEPGRIAQVVYDPSALAAAYAEGLQRGLASVQQTQYAAPVSVNINGPLVGGGYGGYVDPFWPYDPSLITTSFDGGRSRHLTLRMLMQDQFAYDREGPYLIVDRFPPVGPNLATFLPRGLPMFVRPGSRVVTY